MEGRQSSCFAAVIQTGSAIEFLSAELNADKEVVLAAVTTNGFAMQFLSAELKVDKKTHFH